jgi:PAS domain S-box-containing protein
MSEVEAKTNAFASPYIRYASTVAAVAVAFVVRFGLVESFGQGFPPFIIFYPAVMAVAIFAGFWPGVLATALATLVVDYWIFPPRGSFAIASTADAVALAIFVTMGVFVSLLAEANRRNQRTMAAYKRELALREGQAKLEEASEEIKRQAEMLRLSFDAIIVWQLGGVIESWNLGAEHLYGYSEAEAVGRATHELLRTTHPVLWPEIEAKLRESGGWEGELRHITKSGRVVVVLARHQLMIDGDGIERVLETNRDITRRKQAEEALQMSQAKLEGIIGSAMDAVVSVNSEQRIIVFNRAAEAVFQCGASEALGSTLDRFIPQALREGHREHIRRFGAAGVTARSMISPGILSAVRANGEEFPIEATISHVHANGEKIYTVILRDITERKRAEQRIAHLANFPELNTNPILETDLDGRITYSNPAAGRRFPTLGEAGGEHPILKDWAAIVRPLKEGERHSTQREVESDGSVFLQTIHYVPEAGVVRAYFADISKRMRVEEELRASEQRWATTLQSIGDAVISTDATGKIEFMNEVAERLTGWPLAEAQGSDLTTVFDIVQEVTRIKPESPVAKVIRLGEVVGLANHTALIRRDGTEIAIEDSGAPIRNRKGEIAGVVLVFHDVTEQRKVEKALRERDRLATMGRLAATIAHEIHNPLDAVGNLLFLIGQGSREGETRQYVAMASGELARVTQLTQQMLTFQREAAKPILVRIGEIFENVIALYERKIHAAGITLKEQIDFEGHILALPGEMRQIFANLVGNAIEAVGSRHGTITLRAYASRDWRRDRPGLRVVVADNGPGIPAEVRASIFDPFFTTKGENGTGLGLWITSDILRKYDGTIRLRSSTQPHRCGTCFSVFFPFAKGPSAPERP